MFDRIPDEYFYNLPDDRIARYPLADRDDSRLLVFRNGGIGSDKFFNIANYLPGKSLLVFNNTRVIRARLIFKKKSGARIEVFCLEPITPADYSLSLGSSLPVEWKCMIGNLKKWKDEVLELSFNRDGMRMTLLAEKISSEGDACCIRFSWGPGRIGFGEVIESAGHIPLPPYIDRDDEDSDAYTYQTVYSAIDGSVAAPTAGLHFTPRVFDLVRSKGIEGTYLTLHVGAGTFQPVKTDRISEHIMHTEHFFISRKTIETILQKSGNIIAVGTTSVRTLESLYWLGAKIINNGNVEPGEIFIDQWEPYKKDQDIPLSSSLEALISWMTKKNVKVLHAPTRIIIVPGYHFRVTDGLITNFHQPGSTLLLLVAAWAGDDWQRIYKYALENNFRFLSYGDSSLLLKQD